MNPHLVPGVNNVASYQVSGDPYITGSLLNASQIVKIKFPFVTKEILIKNTGSNPLGICFKDPTVNANVQDRNHVFDISSGDSLSYQMRCREIYFSGSVSGQTGFQLLGQLTGIPSEYVLTGSGIDE